MQQLWQSLPSVSDWPPHAWVIASPMLAPTVVAYAKAGPWRIVARIKAIARRRRYMVVKVYLNGSGRQRELDPQR